MTKVEQNRLVIHCDRCPVRLDLGMAAAAAMRRRTPSGWFQTGNDTHLCPICAQAAFTRHVA